MTQKQARNRVWDVTGSFDFGETHPYDLKKQGGKCFPSQFHRLNELLPEFYEKRKFDRCSWFSTMNGRFRADFGQIL